MREGDLSEAAEAAAEEEDDVWSEEHDDRTDETLRWLRDKRRAHQRQRRRDTAVLIYCVILAVLGYG
ncbi:hypothetical protein ADK38_36590, partial [Streptomyces varsoviensis]